MKYALLLLVVLACVACEPDDEGAPTTIMALDGAPRLNADGNSLTICVKNIGDGEARDWIIDMNFYSDTAKRHKLGATSGPHYSTGGNKVRPGENQCYEHLSLKGLNWANVRAYDGTLTWYNHDDSKSSATF